MCQYQGASQGSRGRHKRPARSVQTLHKPPPPPYSQETYPGERPVIVRHAQQSRRCLMHLAIGGGRPGLGGRASLGLGRGQSRRVLGRGRVDRLPGVRPQARLVGRGRRDSEDCCLLGTRWLRAWWSCGSKGQAGQGRGGLAGPDDGIGQTGDGALSPVQGAVEEAAGGALRLGRGRAG